MCGKWVCHLSLTYPGVQQRSASLGEAKQGLFSHSLKMEASLASIGRFNPVARGPVVESTLRAQTSWHAKLQ